MRKHLRYGAIASAVVAPAAAAVAIMPTASATGGGTPSSAFGIYAAGLVNIPRTPEVSSESHPSTKSVVSVPGNPLVHLSVIRTRAVPGHAEASVVDLKVAKAAISPDAVLSAKLISARCDDGDGSSRLVNVRLAGHAIQAGMSPNSRLTVPVEGLGGVQVTVNKQVRNPDGSVTVTALELAVQALGKSQTIAVSSATCAGSSGEAPRPTPVPSNLPVTG
ncbi:choice-of-anchor P family protein [Actinoallomurus acaciae]|uniref:Choice-of-anchor P family protein n=1 Tax=Actinoallomurus acaciae TaxID=502577 RepID=A0ABV5YNK9_9ACTN